MALLLARHVMAEGVHSNLETHLLSVEHATSSIRAHRVSRRPQCSVCGDPSLMKEQMLLPWKLAPVAKQHPHVGGYRRASAGDTFDRFKDLVDPHVGVVTFLSRVSRSEGRSAPVFVSGYPVAVSETERGLDCTRLCAGKGRSEAQARASALCEALERRSGVFQGDEARLRATTEELGRDAYPPHVLEAFSDRQFDGRVEHNGSTTDPALWVPERLPADVPIDWAPAWSLTRDCRRYVPFTYCFAGSPEEGGTAYCRLCGNGVAAGTCLEEALLQGLLELIERDAVAVWWYNRVGRPEVNPETLPVEVSALLRDYERDGGEAWLLDLTHDLGIAVCAAVARRLLGERIVYSFGFGCHLAPELAAERALTELHQLGDGLNPGTGKPYVDTARLADHSFLVPRGKDRTDWRSLPHFDGGDLQDDIEHCVAALRHQDLELIAVDKTRPDVGMHVVQTIVPGLRHMRPRFAPGRLYDVPVKMGWLDVRRTEDTLTQVPLSL
jgi:ribosomal protein S12 methylthiotransferase accessory factor